jgi:hypothetical protein
MLSHDKWDHLKASFPKEGAQAMIWKTFEGKIHLMEATKIGSLFGLLCGSQRHGFCF